MNLHLMRGDAFPGTVGHSFGSYCWHVLNKRFLFHGIMVGDNFANMFLTLMKQ